MEKSIKMIYKNYKGIISIRHIIPVNEGISWRKTIYHPEEQWIIQAYDIDKKEIRDFALKDIIKIE